MVLGVCLPTVAVRLIRPAALWSVLALGWPFAAAAEGDRSRWTQESWNVEDGLPVQDLNQILQGRDGYLWIASFDGLVRFDGVRFVVFDTGASAELPSSRITRLHETADGTLWLATEQGHIVAFREGRFQLITDDVNLPPSPVRFFFEDAELGLLAATRAGLRRIAGNTLVALADGQISGISAAFRTRDGRLFLGTTGGQLARLHNGRIIDIELDQRRVPIAAIEDILEDDSGRLWAGSAYGLFTIEKDKSLPFRVDGRHWDQPVRSLENAPGGTMWVGTGSGFFDFDGARFVRVDSDSESPSVRLKSVRTGPGQSTWLLTEKYLYRNGVRVFESPGELKDIAFDHEEGVWITTSRGLFRLKPRLFDVYGEPEGVVQDIIYPVLEDRQGAIWVGTLHNGMSRISAEGVTSLTEEAGNLPNGAVSALELDPEGRLVVGTRHRGLCRLEGARCEPFGQDGPGGEPGWTMITDIHYTADGRLWVGTNSKGLFRYHPSDGWRQFLPEHGLAHTTIRVIHEDPDQTLWIGTSGGGLSRYRDGVLTTLSEEQGLSSPLIRSIYRDERGVLWVGTEGRGLNRITFSGDRPVVTAIRKSDGLFDDVIHQILPDDAGRLWMNSNRGIFWVSRRQLDDFASGAARSVRSASYSERDGLRNREGNGGMQPAGIRAADGRLWFPTQAGVVSVDPARLRRNDAPPRVVIEELRSGDRSQTSGAIFEVEPDSRDLEIHYTALSFQEPANVRFQYRLDGYDDDWIEVGNRRAAYYTGVPAGQYRFQVIAANNDGVWNREGATIQIAVIPRWYERAWFWPLLILAGFSTAAGGYGWRVRRLKTREAELSQQVAARTAELQLEKEASDASRREAERLRQEAERQSAAIAEALAKVEEQAARLQEHDEARSRLFADVSHEFRTPLTLTIGPLQDLLEGRAGPLRDDIRGQVKVALTNSRRLLTLINEILEMARVEAGQLELNREPTDLGDLLGETCRSFVPLAERKRIALGLATPQDPVSVVADRELLSRVVGNLLSNAFRFTPEGGSVDVELAIDAGRALIRIVDTGPGIPPAQLPHVFERFYRGSEGGQAPANSTGIGLALSRELVEMHGGTIQASNAAGGGACFEVSLPGAAPADSSAAAQPLRRQLSEINADDTGPTPSAGEAVGSEDVKIVLVVDDNPDIRHYIGTHLQPHYRIEESSDGGQALATARRLRPDLIISDVMMPGLDGHQLCRALRDDPELSCTPVILLTARADRQDRIRGLDTGADDYLTKPFDADELLARTRNLIQSRLRLRERLRKEAALRPEPVETMSADERFLRRVREAVERENDAPFGVHQLARAVGMSRGHLHRRLRQLLGQTPTEVIRSIRLERAAELLAAGAGSVSEIAYATGFQSVSHFCRCFKQRYGCTPAAYEPRS